MLGLLPPVGLAFHSSKGRENNMMRRGHRDLSRTEVFFSKRPPRPGGGGHRSGFPLFWELAEVSGTVFAAKY